MMQRSGIILLLLFIFLQQSAQAQSDNASHPLASHGILDLSNWGLDSDGSIRLDGQWAFYWKQLLTPQDVVHGIKEHQSPQYIEVPQTWGAQQLEEVQLSNKGYGTYRLTILLHPEDQGRVLALAMPSIATAYTLWINGQIMDSQGTVGTTKGDMVAQNFTKSVYFTTVTPQVDLVLQVSNFVQRKGGVWSSLTLGIDERVTLTREKSIIIQTTIAGGLFIMGLYHIGLYLFRRVYIPTLWFGTASLLICFRTLFTGDYLWNRLWSTFPWELAVKVEYLSAYLAIGILILYTHSLYPHDLNKKLTYSLFAVIVIISVPVVIWPAHIYTEAMLLSQLILIVSMMYPVIGVIHAAIRKRLGAKVNLIFLFLFFATVVNDTLFYNYIVKSGDLLPWGLYVLLFAQTLILAGRFSGAFAQVENLSTQLHSANQTLELKVKERTQELVLANEQLEGMESSRRHMLANISHEFGTPLTSLIGYVTVMREEDLPPHSKKYMDIIHDKATLLYRLTGDLKNLIQLEAEKMQLIYTVANLFEWYCSIGNKFEMDVKAAGIHYIQTPISHQNTDIWKQYVKIDMARMDQVLTNLIYNAISHTTEGGSITIKARYYAPWRKVIVVITDTGSGIRRDDIPYIFDRFYKGSHSIHKQLPGSGLGLSITREIVQQHGGRLGVRSIEGKGSSFYILLPLYTL
jgi:signal transduction histidine kinase